MVDLHVHSTCSDGTFSPKELVDYAITKKLYAFALTDHDCVDGLDEVLSYAAGLENAPIIIPGVELSTEYMGKDVHIVGLFIDYKNPEFRGYLKDFLDSRDLRNRKMCDKLAAGTGMDISYDKLLEEFPNSVITRAHYAKYMLNHGYTKSMKECFERYVGDNCPYYIPREKVTPEQGIEMILKAGGLPILAHPILYHLSDSNLDILVSKLKAAGLVGIEAVYSTYSTAEERQIRELAAKYDLLVSGGSDFHGENKPGLDLAVGYGKLYVHDEVYENLLQEYKRRNK